MKAQELKSQENGGIPQYMFDLQAKHLKYGGDFKRIFGVTLHQFWDVRVGFDVVGFDAWLKTPDDVSTAQYVQKKYGEKALALCRTLMAPI